VAINSNCFSPLPSHGKLESTIISSKNRDTFIQQYKNHLTHCLGCYLVCPLCQRDEMQAEKVLKMATEIPGEEQKTCLLKGDIEFE